MQFIITLLVCDSPESVKAIKKSVEKTIKNKSYAKSHKHLVQIKIHRTLPHTNVPFISSVTLFMRQLVFYNHFCSLWLKGP